MYLNRKVQFVPFAEESSSPLQPLRYSFTDIFMNINLKKIHNAKNLSISDDSILWLSFEE